MKYFFISDIHGQYKKMVKALADAGFNAEKDTLVNLGDAFDRGPQSKEVLDYLLNCPNRILLYGNHDARLELLVKHKDFVNEYDFYNGVPATIKSFCGWQTEFGRVVNEGLSQMYFNPKLMQYWNELCWAVEFPDLIATHAWLPMIQKELKPHYYVEELDNDWRNKTSWEIWYEALWAHTEKVLINRLFPDKKIIVGHWHAWRIAEHYMEKRYTDRHLRYPQIDCSTFFYSDKAIFIDGMTNYEKGGQVNVYIYESDSEPIIYKRIKAF